MPHHATSERAIVAAQLLAHLGPSGGNAVSNALPGDAAVPLTPMQYRELEVAAAAKGISLADALSMDADTVSPELGLQAEWLGKLPSLAARGTQVALDLERLSGFGIRALCDSDPDYPVAWTRHLGRGAPPLVFACGHASAWNAAASISVAGSRDVAAAGREFAVDVGTVAAALGAVTVTGGARGVDKLALEGAMEGGGVSVAVVPADMLATVKQVDPGLVSEGRIGILSPIHPKMRWTAGLAMARNRLIYCLSRVGVVVSSGLEEGGTWSGAKEVLRHGWVPLLVMGGESAPEGNRRLIEMGGLEISSANLEEMIGKILAGEDLAPAVGSDVPCREGKFGSTKSKQLTLGF